MIKIFRMFCRAIGLVLSVVWPPAAGKLWHSVLTNVYTGWLKRRFASLGSDTVVSYRALNLRGLRHVHVGAGTMIGANVQLTAWRLWCSTDKNRQQMYNPRLRAYYCSPLHNNRRQSADGDKCPYLRQLAWRILFGALEYAAALPPRLLERRCCHRR